MNRFEPKTRAEAIRDVLNMAISIEGEWGSADEHRGHADGKRVLLMLGVSEEEIPDLVPHPRGGYLHIPDPEETPHG